jgi:pSer/pThr/pTyr-binding forkhead associated (FHA) protein
MVSRSHALIVIDGNETFVRDLASRNGVYVNGLLVREGKLRHGDLLCVGPFAFWWRLGPLPGPRPRHLGRHFDNAALLTVDGEREPHRMESQSFLIGRRAECDLMVDSMLLEPSHAVVYRQGGEYWVRDLNSESGTFVNNRRVRNSTLRRGDEIRVGVTRIEFQPPEAPPSLEDRVMPDKEDIAGLAAAPFADRNMSDAGPMRACPTIDQLLGVSWSQSSIKWEWGRF